MARSAPLNDRAATNWPACSTVMAFTSAMLRPASRTASASARSRAPWHSGHVVAVWYFFTTNRLPTS